MNGRIILVLLLIGVLVLSSSTLLAQERWVYNYNGFGSGEDRGYSIAMGSDSNLYSAGYSEGSGTGRDFVVVSLTASGEERWVYRYAGSAGAWDCAYSIIVGSDGNVYAAGFSDGIGTYSDFTVISLTPSGGERWVYKYNGPAGTVDAAYSIVMGADGNLYAAGESYGATTGSDFLVISLADSGVERWVYRYNGSADAADCAYSLVVGADGNLYAAGASHESWNLSDFIVVSLTSLGAERWIYRYSGSSCGDDEARSIVMGSGETIYAAGWSDEIGTSSDMTVISLDTSGVEQWIYRYDEPANSWDYGHSIASGLDGNLYAGGMATSSDTSRDFTVVSVTASGNQRWAYRYNEPRIRWECARSVAVGSDGNVYAAGEIYDGVIRGFSVVSLTDAGEERWVYGHRGAGANFVLVGSDGNIYAVGLGAGSGTGSDFTVVSLSADVGVTEDVDRRLAHSLGLWQNSPNPFSNSTTIQYSISLACEVTLSIYDITGRLVEALVNGTQQPGIHQVRWGRKTNPSGVYFYQLKAGEFVKTRKMVVVE